jgi:hypothetical protein
VQTPALQKKKPTKKQKLKKPKEPLFCEVIQNILKPNKTKL